MNLLTGADMPAIESQFIFQHAPYPSCHASTIVETGDGLAAAWFGGTAEKNSDVGIRLTHNRGGSWTEPVEVVTGVQSPTLRFPCWNPVLFQPRGGPLLLFYRVGPSPSTWWGMRTSSTDGGRSWSDPRRLPDGIFGPIKNKPVALDDGEILCPSSDEAGGWRVHFERTSDLGATWERTAPVNDGRSIAAIQPSVLIHPDGRLQAVGRTKQGRIFTVHSEDRGHTWGEMTLTDLPNPDSGTDAVTLADSRFLLVYNHTAHARTPLNVAISNDGVRWASALSLESEPGEFSYPAVIQAHDGRVHITYTWNRRRIKHVVVDPDTL